MKSDGWRKIDDGAPKDGTWVLLWWPHWHHAPLTGYWDYGWQSERAISDDGVGPTHWQPLPEPPEPPEPDQ